MPRAPRWQKTVLNATRLPLDCERGEINSSSSVNARVYLEGAEPAPSLLNSTTGQKVEVQKIMLADYLYPQLLSF